MSSIGEVWIFSGIAQYRPDRQLVCGKIYSAWNYFELTANVEVQYLQEIRIETVSHSSKNIHRARRSRKSKGNSISTSTGEHEKYDLQKEGATLKIKLVFAEEEQILR